MFQITMPGVSVAKRSKSSSRKGIVPQCELCGKPLVKVFSGLVCIEGHGRIIPIEEFLDLSHFPVNHQACETVKQMPTGKAAQQIATAQRRLAQLNQKKENEHHDQ